MSEKSKRVVRIHVGGLSKELSESIDDLENRFSKIGKVIKSFEIHRKPVSEYIFAFITMELTKSEFGKLKKLWDGVRFKGSKLSIAVAKDDYKTLWEKDSRRQDNHILNRQKRERIALSRSIRIEEKNKNPFKLALVSKGRLRKTPRKTELKNLTIRVNINGKLKIIKCKKDKLWGVDKNRKIKDLTYRFIAGEWRDGNDHVVDRLTNKVIVFGDNITVQNDKGDKNIDDEVQQELLNEQDRNNQLLANMLGKYNFDKPLELDFDGEENETDCDYEIEHVNEKDEEEEKEGEKEEEEEITTVYYDNIPEKNCIHPSREDLLRQYNEQSAVITFEDSNADGNDFYQNLKPQNLSEEEISIEKDNSDYDNEFIPSFGKSNHEQDIDKNDDDDEKEFIPSFGQDTSISDKKNTTEKLRDLLKTSNITATIPIDDISKDTADNITLPLLKKTKNVGLFFSHFDSPFLVAQAQINKLREIKVGEEMNYDEWFWSNRGELNREFRRLRRDVLRRNKKKTKNATLI
jgi:nucleolar protein 8